MASPAANPLFKHFRQPTIYLKLPSQGRFWPNAAIEIPVTGELPIYPMTVKDEISIKTPDALMNGSGVVDVIQSCCPSIKNAWATPLIDLDAILIAIRSASYGHIMDIDTTCPNCSAENSHSVDLRVLLDSIHAPDYNPVTIDNLVFQFKPQEFKNLNQANQINFTQQKLIDTISRSDLDEDTKMAEFQRVFPTLTDLNIMTLVNSIESITVDGQTVTNIDHIKEFVTNCDRNLYSQIKEIINDLAATVKLRPLDVQCTECSTTYTTEINFDQASFFE